MNDFENALDFVHRTLAQLKEDGAMRKMKASAPALERLSEAMRFAAPVTEAHAPSPPAVARPIAPPFEHPLNPRQPTSFTRPPSAPSQSRAEKESRLAALRDPVLGCLKCEHLAASRTQVVFGVGNVEAEVMFVGEAPGEDEDLQGEPFVGKAGQLLTKIIEAMGFPRADIYIANVLKCRPDMPAGVSGNRKPKLDEMRTCLPYLEQQIEIIQPCVLVALGATAMEGLLGETSPMNKLRGRWHDFHGTPLMATYHPAYLLRNQSITEKRKVWEDMLMVLERLEKPISARQRGYFLAK